MATSKSQKAEILKKLSDDFKAAKTIVFASYAGLPVKEFESLRRSLRKNNVGCRVAKKTLMNLAAKEAGISNLDAKAFQGSIVAMFSFGDEMMGARIAHKFAKDHAVFVIRGGIADGAVHDERYIISLAQLPTREELLSKMLGSLMSPVSGFHRVLHGVLRGFCQVIKALSEKQA